MEIVLILDNGISHLQSTFGQAQRDNRTAHINGDAFDCGRHAVDKALSRAQSTLTAAGRRWRDLAYRALVLAALVVRAAGLVFATRP